MVVEKPVRAKITDGWGVVTPDGSIVRAFAVKDMAEEFAAESRSRIRRVRMVPWTDLPQQEARAAIEEYSTHSRRRKQARELRAQQKHGAAT